MSGDQAVGIPAAVPADADGCDSADIPWAGALAAASMELGDKVGWPVAAVWAGVGCAA
jgi:hypothetical protein